MEELVEVCIWPDDTWCFKSDLWQMAHMSDDYVVELLSEEELDELDSSWI